MAKYPKHAYETGRDSSVLQDGRKTDKVAAVRPNLPGNVILVHGVNDVGVGFGEAEKGLCAGLGTRLGCEGRFKPASYRMPGEAGHEDDRFKLEDDPDAVFFKRQLSDGVFTPVIPFYWGYRPAKDNSRSGQSEENIHHGQNTDRYGNRLDKDFSKGGGPFANATSTLADMWNRGFGSGPGDVVDRLSRDPLRPVLDGPGRMYMVLAAKRLAALISMIRDYDADEVVSIVAHSQGCLISLLAQVFLMQQGMRPADTLVLTHPPYSLVDDIPFEESIGDAFSGGEDQAMHGNYECITGRQTMHARLQTLVNIVQGVVEGKHVTPTLTALTDAGTYRGMVGAHWLPDEDRDNRGKVYLYFCPEDMTVALNTMQGIGWQGVPDFISGQRAVKGVRDSIDKPTELHTREALKELMTFNGQDKGFFQRVFTAKLRTKPGERTPRSVLVGDAPHDFVLRLAGESAHGHADRELDSHRATAPEADPNQSTTFLGFIPKSAETLRLGIRRITGEALKIPVKADMYAGAIGTNGQREAIDPIDAAIATTSRYGFQTIPAQVIDDPRPAGQGTMLRPGDDLLPSEKEALTKFMNEGKKPGDCYVLESARYLSKDKLQVVRYETPNEVRLRQQSSTAARTFHSAIFGSATNHRQVTAYDLSIGGGKAVSDPVFSAYLCAVADWRLKKRRPATPGRPQILDWNGFLNEFDQFYGEEDEWRKALIEGNCDYYSEGTLPRNLPILPSDLPSMVLCETIYGRRAETSAKKPETVK